MCVFRYRRPLEPGLKIAITLRFLATGNSFRSMEFNWAYCAQYYRHVHPRGVRCHRRRVRPRSLPHSNYDRRLAGDCSRFSGQIELPSCLWSNRWQACSHLQPKQSGSIYYNYKRFFSIVILVLCDANYKAILAHVGSPGSQSDCGIYNDSPMFQGIQDETIKLPPPQPLPNHTEDTLYFFIGDDAFPLRQHMLKPFSARYLEAEQLVFNYRLSRARRIVENLFGILASRF